MRWYTLAGAVTLLAAATYGCDRINQYDTQARMDRSIKAQQQYDAIEQGQSMQQLDDQLGLKVGNQPVVVQQYELPGPYHRYETVKYPLPDGSYAYVTFTDGSVSVKQRLFS